MNPPIPDPPGRSSPTDPPGQPVAIALVRKAPRPEESADRPTPAEPASQSRTNSAAAAGLPAFGLTIPRRPPSASDVLTDWLTKPFVAAPTVLVCLALLGWSLLLRLPAQPIIAKARPPATPSSPTPDREDVNALASQAALAVTQVVTNTDQLPRLISVLEQQARAAGFVADLATRAPVFPVPGIPELARHPVVFRLENNYDRSEPAFSRLLDWLRAASSLGVKVDVGAVTLQSLGDGLATATVELCLLSLSPITDAKTAAK